MREISATEAARRFSAVLDAIEHDGESFVVTRAGRRIARIQPATGASGAAVKKLLRAFPQDSDWLEELDEPLAHAPAQDRHWRD